MQFSLEFILDKITLSDKAEKEMIKAAKMAAFHPTQKIVKI